MKIGIEGKRVLILDMMNEPMITWDMKHRTPSLSQFVLSSARRMTRNDTGRMINEIKARMMNEPDDYKKQCWAEVGLEMNRILMKL